MLLDVRNTDKKFNGVYALKDLNFSLDAGEIHGLVGENGAGKSTFIKILGGVYKRDGGSILWDGKELLEEIRPEESRNLGINIIFQDNVLIPAFTGAENICLGRPYPVKGGLIRWKEMEREAEENDIAYGYRLLEAAGKKRGFLISGGEVDTERMAKILLDEFRSGKLGRFTLELP